MTPIRLEEHSSETVPDLGMEDWRFLALRHQRAVAISIDPLSGSPRLTASSWVGVITLPSGRELRIRTKVPVASLFHMLAVADRWPFQPEDIVGYAPEASILYVVARYFRDQLLRLDEGGLYRAYRDEDANVTTLRGRINFREDLRRNVIERQRTACSFSDFTRDIPENQILRQAAHLLADSGLVGDLAGAFRNLDYWWSDIRLTRHDPDVVTAFVYHRLNENYRTAHQLASLLLRWLSPGGTEGALRFPAFLVNMNSLFEDFVRVSVGRAIGDSVLVRKPKPFPLDEAGRAQIQPDLLLEVGGIAVLVADSKYKRVGTDSGSESDVYQVISYCTGLGLTEGVLIYPRHLVDLDDHLIIRHSDLRVNRVAINLGLPPSELNSESARLGKALLELCLISSQSTTVLRPH